jgi:PAS domain S-box-containing protein
VAKPPGTTKLDVNHRIGGETDSTEREWRATGVRRFVLALVLATLIAIADALAGRGAVLISVLVAAPLVAATASGGMRTAVVAAYTVGLGVLLGVPDHIFGSVNHLVRLTTVVVGGALAVWVATLRERRERDSLHLRVQYEVAQILSEADSLEQSAPRLLAAVGRPLGWEVGALWRVTPSGLRCAAGWYPTESGQLANFREATEKATLARGVGLPGRAWDREEPIWVADVLKESNFPRAEAAAEAGLRGGMALPIFAGGEVIGAADFFAREVRSLDEELVALLSAVGAQIGEFVERLRAASALRESEARKAAMLESALDCVMTMDHEGRVVEMNAAAERTFGYRPEEVVGEEMAALIIPPSLRNRHREALRRYVETEEPTILGRRIELTGMRSDGTEFPVELAINRIGDRSPPMFTGYIRDITDRRHGEEDREELLRLEQLARLDASRARDQLEAILSGVADGITAQAPDGTIVFANDAAVETLGYSSQEELLAAPLSETMDRFELLDEGGDPFPADRLPGRLALQGEGTNEALVRFRIRASGEERWSLVKATPILDEQGETVMVINVFEDVTGTKRAEVQSRFLAESSRILGASLDPDDTLQRVARLAVPEVADWCAVDLRGEGGAIDRVALAHSDPRQLEMAEEFQREYPPDPAAQTGVPQVLRTGEPELYPDISDEMLQAGAVDERHLEILRGFGFRSAMAVPMVARDQVVGVLTFVSGRSGRRFDETDLALAEELGRRCATALDNARLYGERAYIARTLQQSLLPAELPIIPGLETAARFHATGHGTDVGGDFYDLFQTGTQGWTVVVGDVCGKGPDAAAVTALARYTLRAAAMQERLPSNSLRILNEALLRQREDRRFCTVAYAYFEPDDGGARVGLASGGHPLPLVLRSDGTVEALGTHGTLLGVVPDPDLEDRAATLEAGDALVFYTDGVTEARGANGLLGEKGLVDLVASCAGLGADAIASRVEAAALDVQHGEPRDDIAVVVLRVAA